MRASQKAAAAVILAISAAAPRAFAGPPTLPSIQGPTILVTAAPYNAVAGGNTDNAPAIQSAINACSAGGGGTVEIPAAGAQYECGLLQMASNVNLQIDSGAELQALASLSASGTPWIYVKNVTNWEISGTVVGTTKGILDGNATAAGSLNLIRLSGATVGLIQNLAIINSPHEHINADGGINNVTINAVDINTPAGFANTDGIDPAGLNWLIENCTITDGDDDIAVKPQIEVCSNIDVENCVIGAGHGVSVGGETNFGLNGMIVNNVTFNGTTDGLRLKAGVGNGGNVSNMAYSNITMTNVKNPIEIDSYYNAGDNIPTDPTQPAPAGADTPTWNNISFTKVTAVWDPTNPSFVQNTYNNSVAGWLWGLPQAPLNNIKFTAVQIGQPNTPAACPPTGLQTNNVRDVTFDSASQIYTVAGTAGDLISTKPVSPAPTAFNQAVPYDSVVTPAPFLYQNIGSPTIPAADNLTPALYDPDTQQFTLQGGGAGFGSINSGADQLTYVSSPSSFFTHISAQLLQFSMAPSRGSPIQVGTPLAGVMIRVGTDTSGAFMAFVQGGFDKMFLIYRPTAAAPVQTLVTLNNKPIGSTLLELGYVNNTIVPIYTTDGIHWTYLAPVNIAGTDLARPNSAITMGVVAMPGINGHAATAIFAKIQRGFDNPPRQ